MENHSFQFRNFFCSLSLGAGFLLISQVTHALPFNIVPAAGTTLPTAVTPGGTATAFYTVTNNTSFTLVENYVKWFPLNVTQVLSDNTSPFADLCGATFTLQPNGSTGDSCTLELTVSGAVNANDPDPHHHLFVCLPGGTHCAGPINPLNVNALGSQQLVTVGFSSTIPFNFTSTNPIAYISNDNGNNWTLSSPFIVPSVSLGLANQLSRVRCLGNRCVTVGSYTQSTPGTLRPLIYTTDDGGISWSTPILPAIPAGTISAASLVGLACNAGTHCTTVGTYTMLGVLHPLVYTSNDSGSTWSAPITPPSMGSFSTRFKDIACVGSSCIAIGTFLGSSGFQQPFFSHSVDGGSTWSTPILLTVVGNGSTAMEGITCTNTTCIIAGAYTQGIAFNPLIYISADGGITWSLPTTPPIDVPSTFPQNDNILSGISCANNFCTTVGSYTNNASFTPSRSNLSYDNGNHWLPVVLPPVPLGNANINATLPDIICRGTICTTVGSYEYNASGDAPLVYVSQSAGLFWSLGLVPQPTSIQELRLTSIDTTGT